MSKALAVQGAKLRAMGGPRHHSAKARLHTSGVHGAQAMDVPVLHNVGRMLKSSTSHH